MNSLRSFTKISHSLTGQRSAFVVREPNRLFTQILIPVAGRPMWDCLAFETPGDRSNEIAALADDNVLAWCEANATQLPNR